MRGRISISLRLTLWFGAAFFAGWVLFGVSMWANLRSTLKNERHLTLTRRVDRLQELLVKDLQADAADRFQDFSDFAHATGNGLAQVLRADGTPEYPSPSAAASSFPWPKVPMGDANLFVNVQSAGQSYWVLMRPFSLPGRTLVLVAAAPEAGNLVVMQNFLRGLLGFVPVLLVISSVGGYWMSRRALKPVDRIAATARSISIRNISERVPVTPTGDELQRLAETCNAMLDRLETSLNQMKRFTADASHELRGPLSFVRTVAEVALKNPDADSASQLALQEIVDEVEKAAVLLEEMLTLARADSAPGHLAQTQVNLSEMVEDVCEMAQTLAMQNSIRFALHREPEDVTVLGDGASLKRLTWVLLDNAMKYSRPGGRVDVSLHTIAGRPEIVVCDEGIGISPKDLPFVFDRFYRADPSRGLVEGNGLGLAIGKWIAETHSAELLVTSQVGGGTTFRIVFPKPTERIPHEPQGEGSHLQPTTQRDTAADGEAPRLQRSL